jgi:hypothetical protein
MYKKEKLPFVALSGKLYSTGRKSPAFEFSIRATNFKLECSITKRKYRFSEVLKWWQSPEIQKYVKEGWELYIESKTQEPFKQPKYGENLEQIICFRMKKPYQKRGNLGTFKTVEQSVPFVPQQFAPDQAEPVTKNDLDDMDDKIPLEEGDSDEWNNQF